MTTEEFPAIFSHFKEGSRQINESKALEWMDGKVKTKEIDISNDIIDQKWQRLAIIGVKNKPQRSSNY